jgi:hypothetical protein
MPFRRTAGDYAERFDRTLPHRARHQHRRTRHPPDLPQPKNALFASGHEDGARWAAVASLVETCKVNGVHPQRHFTEVLRRIVNGWPNSRIDELMRWCWGAADLPLFFHPVEVRGLAGCAPCGAVRVAA